MGVPAIDLGPGNNRVCLVEDQRRGFQVIEPVLGTRWNHVFGRVVTALPFPTAILFLGGWKKVIASIPVLSSPDRVTICHLVISECIARFGKIDLFKNAK